MTVLALKSLLMPVSVTVIPLPTSPWQFHYGTNAPFWISSSQPKDRSGPSARYPDHPSLLRPELISATWPGYGHPTPSPKGLRYTQALRPMSNPFSVSPKSAQTLIDIPSQPLPPRTSAGLHCLARVNLTRWNNSHRPEQTPPPHAPHVLTTWKQYVKMKRCAREEDGGWFLSPSAKTLKYSLFH